MFQLKVSPIDGYGFANHHSQSVDSFRVYLHFFLYSKAHNYLYTDRMAKLDEDSEFNRVTFINARCG